jgi:hypothetical protein
MTGLDQDEVSCSGPFDNGSFLGKMHFFFPSFFNKLSSDELGYLKNNESWVLEIFGDFWDLLMKKIEDLGDHHGLNSIDLDCDKQPLCSPWGYTTSPPTDYVSSEEIPTKHMGPEKLTTIGRGMLIGGCSKSLPPTKVTDVLEVPIGGVCLDQILFLLQKALDVPKFSRQMTL